MPADGPSGIGSCITFQGRTSSFRRTPSRTLNSRSRLTMRSPIRSSSGDVHRPAGHRGEQPRVGLVQEEPEAALRREPAHHEAVVHRGEVLALRGEGGLVLRRAPVEPLRVLGRGARVVVAPAPGRRRVPDRHALERARRVGGQLEPLDRVGQPLGPAPDLPGQPPASPRPAGHRTPRGARSARAAGSSPRGPPTRTTRRRRPASAAPSRGTPPRRRASRPWRSSRARGGRTGCSRG